MIADLSAVERRFKDATELANNAGGGENLRPCFQFHIPLAEQRRRRFAKPQRLVRLQHGIPHFFTA